MWVVHLTPLTPPAQYYFPPYTPKSNFKIIPFNDFLLLNGVGLFFPKILDNLEVVTISDYIEVQTQTRSKQTRNDQIRVPQTRWNAFTFLNHTFLGLTRFNFKRCGGHMAKSVFKIIPLYWKAYSIVLFGLNPPTNFLVYWAYSTNQQEAAVGFVYIACDLKV